MTPFEFWFFMWLFFNASFCLGAFCMGLWLRHIKQRPAPPA